MTVAPAVSCGVCATPLDASTQRCPSCGAATSTRPAAPVSDLPTLLAGCVRAGSGLRAVAVVVDVVIMLALVAVVLLDPVDVGSVGWALPGLFLLLTVVVLSLTGRTVGSWVAGARTVDLFTGLALGPARVLTPWRADGVTLDVRRGRDPFRTTSSARPASPAVRAAQPAAAAATSWGPPPPTGHRMAATGHPATGPAGPPHPQDRPTAAAATAEHAHAAVQQAQPPTQHAQAAPQAQPPSQQAQPPAQHAQPAAPQAQAAAQDAQPSAQHAQPTAQHAQPSAQRRQPAAQQAQSAVQPAQSHGQHAHAQQAAQPTPDQPPSAQPPPGRNGGRPPAGAVVTTADGGRFTITGTALLGRNPQPRDGERVDTVVPINDLQRTVSKTHASLRWDGRTLWLSDRGSTNGTAVTNAAGSRQQLQPRAELAVQPGSTIQLGDQTMTVTFPGEGEPR